jgi:hypothetical protein
MKAMEPGPMETVELAVTTVVKARAVAVRSPVTGGRGGGGERNGAEGSGRRENDGGFADHDLLSLDCPSHPTLLPSSWSVGGLIIAKPS